MLRQGSTRIRPLVARQMPGTTARGYSSRVVGLTRFTATTSTPPLVSSSSSSAGLVSCAWALSGQLRRHSRGPPTTTTTGADGGGFASSLSSSSSGKAVTSLDDIDALLNQLGGDGDGDGDGEGHAYEADDARDPESRVRRGSSDKKRNNKMKRRKTAKRNTRGATKEGGRSGKPGRRAADDDGKGDDHRPPSGDRHHQHQGGEGEDEEYSAVPPPPRTTTPTSPGGIAPAATMLSAAASMAANGGGEEASSATTSGSTMGWGYETVDPTTGKTQLEVLYESNLDRIHRILEQPLPPLPQDGHVDPDLFVGFAHYDYRLRDEYRAVLAAELALPVAAVRLSIAWGGRFDVSRFNRVRKVCGVCIDRSTLFPDEVGQNTHGGATGNTSSSSSWPSSSPQRPLPEPVAAAVAALVTVINDRRSERLLQCQLLQASSPIPEVEFAYSHREHRLLVRVHEWIKARVLSGSLAVVVAGGNHPHACATQWRRAESSKSNANSKSNDTCDGAVAEDVAGIARSFARYGAETQRQSQFVTDTWLKPFYNRHLIPRRLSLGAVATMAAAAVLAGEIAQVTAGAAAEASHASPPLSSSFSEEVSLLPANIQAMLTACASDFTVANSNINSVRSDGGEAAAGAAGGGAGGTTTSTADDYDAYQFARQWASRPPAVAAAALQWLQVVREAMFLGEQQQHRLEHTHTTRSSSSGNSKSDSGTTITTTTTTSADEGAYRRLRQQTGDMPALFAHGAYAGGLREMRYLQSNKVAMDALLLHPNDITMKRSFASKMRGGHQRLRMHEEIVAGEHHS